MDRRRLLRSFGVVPELSTPLTCMASLCVPPLGAAAAAAELPVSPSVFLVAAMENENCDACVSFPWAVPCSYVCAGAAAALSCAGSPRCVWPGSGCSGGACALSRALALAPTCFLFFVLFPFCVLLLEGPPCFLLLALSCRTGAGSEPGRSATARHLGGLIAPPAIPATLFLLLLRSGVWIDTDAGGEGDTRTPARTGSTRLPRSALGKVDKYPGVRVGKTLEEEGGDCERRGGAGASEEETATRGTDCS